MTDEPIGGPTAAQTLSLIRTTNIGGIIAQLCDESEDIFQEQLDSYIRRNKLDVTFDVKAKMNPFDFPMTDAQACAIEAAFGFARGWLDNLNPTMLGLPDDSGEPSLIPVVDFETLNDILTGTISVADLCDEDHPHDSFITAPLDRDYEDCIAISVPDDSMFSPFQSRGFLPRNALAIIQLLNDEEEADAHEHLVDGQPVLIECAETGDILIRAYGSGGVFRATNPSYPPCPEGFLLGVVLCCVQVFV